MGWRLLNLIPCRYSCEQSPALGKTLPCPAPGVGEHALGPLSLCSARGLPHLPSQQLPCGSESHTGFCQVGQEGDEILDPGGQEKTGSPGERDRAVPASHQASPHRGLRATTHTAYDTHLFSSSSTEWIFQFSAQSFLPYKPSFPSLPTRSQL